MEDRDPPWNERIIISSDVFEKDIYNLVCIFHASESLSGISKPVSALRNIWQESEVLRLLLNIAVVVRNKLDATSNKTLSGYSYEVGTLIKNILEPSNISTLGFREACNKIIHSESVNFEYHDENPRMGDALKPFLQVYGSLGNKEWEATLDINKFSTLALVLG